jgi:membrane protein
MDTGIGRALNLLEEGKRLIDSPSGELIKRIWTASQDHDVLGHSAQLAYYFFFALFPALIFTTAMLGIFAANSEKLQENLFGYIAAALPPSAYQLIYDTLQQTTRATSAGKLVFGALAALFSASSGMRAAQDTLNAVNCVKETRRLWKTWAISLILTLAGAILVLCASAISFYGHTLAILIDTRMGLGPAVALVWEVLRWPVALFLFSLVFAITYFWAPNIERPKWRWITPGATVGIAGWLTASAALRLYLHYFDRYSATYGSLGAVIVLMIWFYISGLMLLLGAEVNAALEAAQRKRASAS